MSTIARDERQGLTIQNRHDIEKKRRWARRRAHVELDQLWLSGGHTREGAYRLLQKKMDLEDHPHIANFGFTGCKAALAVLRELEPHELQDSYEELERTVLTTGPRRWRGKQYRYVPLAILEKIYLDCRGSARARIGRYLNETEREE